MKDAKRPGRPAAAPKLNTVEDEISRGNTSTAPYIVRVSCFEQKEYEYPAAVSHTLAGNMLIVATAQCEFYHNVELIQRVEIRY